MSEKVSTMDVRTRIGDLLNRVALPHDELIIERMGRPLAALVRSSAWNRGAPSRAGTRRASSSARRRAPATGSPRRRQWRSRSRPARGAVQAPRVEGPPAPLPQRGRWFARSSTRTCEPDAARAWLADLVALADLIPDTGRVKDVCRDPDDDAVRAAAIEGRATALVRGDADLLALGEYEAIAIVTPRRFLKLLAE